MVARAVPGPAVTASVVPSPLVPRTRSQGPVVVGVDGSLGVLTAVSWAACEAARRGVGLHLVHVGAGGEQGAGRGPTVLRRARHTAAAVAPDLSVSVARPEGAAGPALAALSARADRLVVGGRRPGDDPRATRDHTLASVLASARCPVVVVPPRRTGAWASTPSARPVVAMLRGTAGDARVLALAADAARRHRVALLRAVPRTLRPATAVGAPDPVVWDDLAGVRRLALGAQLLVVGEVGPRSADEMHGLLRRGPCAVMVAPPDPA
ncbi:universal stress protein [Actinomycetospora lutea]|uniref:universal stress protein n=1 Tax=Actinomycetospora lutea TaxID=663604 RepID=UPI00236717C6|nr:universal stress protein [Actinomycetospora lutea]MDD7941551.1 universal stress protein [Actinomycetospora lutea]